MASSFDKVCHLLTETPDFKLYLVRVKNIMSEARVCGWKFHDMGDKYKGTDGIELPGYKFLVNWGPNPNALDTGDLIQEVWASQADRFNIETDEFTPKHSLLKIVQDNFGTKKVPSYNCKKDKVETKFVTYARTLISEYHANEYSETEKRLREEMQAAEKSDAFLQDRIVHHERYIANDIKKVLIKYQKVAKPHVLKMALDEFVAHEIMES